MELDGLTGLLRFEGLVPVVADGPVTAVYIDIDGLAWLNYSNGFTAADRAICAVVQCIVDEARPREGVAARIGGDDFVVALPGHTFEQAEEMARAIAAAVERLNLSYAPGSRYLFKQVGVSTMVLTLDAAMLTDRAALVDDLKNAKWEAKLAAERMGRVAATLTTRLRRWPRGGDVRAAAAALAASGAPGARLCVEVRRGHEVPTGKNAWEKTIACLPAGAVASRVGWTTFDVLLPGTRADLEPIADRIRAALANEDERWSVVWVEP